MVRLEEHKHDTQGLALEALPLPAKVYIPLSQHLGKIAEPQVTIGEVVATGQRVASAKAHVTALVHASLSGKVVAIQEYPHPALGRCKAIVIESDGKDTLFQSSVLSPQSSVDALTPEQIRAAVFEAGIVGMGGASFPTHIKLSPPKPVDTLIINGAECEPYLTADYRLMLEKTEELRKGIAAIERCLGVSKVIIAVEDNKPEAIEKFKHISLNTNYTLSVLKSSYPQGGEKQLIKNVLRKEVPSGKLPFDIGIVVQNVSTVFAVYEALFLGKPLYERIVTVAGSPLRSPKNLRVRIGTPIKELIDYCGPLREKPAKIIIGGPMMGIAQYTDAVPVIKSSGGVLLLNEREARIREEEFCIRCGACVRACPAGLMPCLINLASEKEKWTETKAYNALDCIECGVCNYVCPANRRLTQSIKRAKLEINK